MPPQEHPEPRGPVPGECGIKARVLTPQRWLALLPFLSSSLLGCARDPAAVPAASGPMALEQAREYVLALVNRDRDAEGLGPVERDEVAERAAQRHAEDMSLVGFTAHWGSDGSVPEQRYTEAGGQHMVQENAACFFDGVARPLDKDPRFAPAELEKIETAFITEQPPNDGHRKNILKASHNKIGIGLAKPEGIEQLCMAQEFLDVYGEYEAVPERATLGDAITVAGEVFEPATFGGVGLAVIDAAKPLEPSHLNATSTYPIPEPYVVYFPEGFKTPKPVKVDGSRFEISVPLDKGPGRYEVSVWAKFPDSGDSLATVSIRTILVE